MSECPNMGPKPTTPNPRPPWDILCKQCGVDHLIRDCPTTRKETITTTALKMMKAIPSPPTLDGEMEMVHVFVLTRAHGMEVLNSTNKGT